MKGFAQNLANLSITLKLTGGALVAILAIAVAAVLVIQPLAAPSAAAGALAGAKAVSPDTPVSVSFDKPMNQREAQRAFRVQPETEGKFQWQGNTMFFVPANGWARKTSYRVSLDEQAASIFGRPLPRPLAFSFTTADQFAVATVQPAPDTTAVDPEDNILVQFTRPVVPLTSGTQAPAPLDLRIVPELPGSGKWLTTSVFVFKPDGGLRPSTRYTITVPAETKGVDGDALATGFTWTFTTPLAGIAAVEPADNSRFADPRTAVKVIFNQAMDRDSAAGHFRLAKGAGAAPIGGKVSWQDDKTMLFQPSQPLDLASTYTAQVVAGALAQGSNSGTAQDYTWTFGTIGVPRVVSSAPADGQTGIADQRVVIRFSDPMDRDSVWRALSIVPTVTQVYSGWQELENSLIIWGSFEPSTRYQLGIAGSALGRTGLALARPYRFSFTTAPRTPSLRVVGSDWGNFGTFNAYLPSEITVGYVNVPSIDFALYRLDLDSFRQLAVNYRSFQSYAPPAASQLRRWSSGTLPGARDRESFTRAPLANGAPLPPGVYYLEVSAGQIAKAKMLLVSSRLGLTMKRSANKALVWAIDLKSGLPLSNRPISIIGRDGQMASQGRTDGSGVFLGDAPDYGKGPSELANIVFGTADIGEEFALVASSWQPNQDGGDAIFGFPGAGGGTAWTGALYTDRPIYRPGQQVYFKGILRSDDDARYSLPNGQTVVSVVVRDPQGKVLSTQQAKVNEFGGFDGSLALAEQAPVGGYFINANVGEQNFGASFMVAEYRKPEFEAQVSTDRPNYVDGETISVTVKANYFFGAPLAGVPVRWRVFSSDYVFQPPESTYHFVDDDLLRGHESQGQRGQGQAVTDDKGEATFRVPVSLAKDPLSQVLTVEASVTDSNNQEVSARRDVIAHKGDFYVGLRPGRYVGVAGQPQAIQMVSVGKDGRPVAGVAAQLTLYSRRWYSVQEKQPDGTTFWTSKWEDKLLSSQSVTTGEKGEATATFSPQQGGVHRVVALAKDRYGNEVRSATTLYVAGEDYVPWRVENNDRIELIPDKSSYEPGETARVLVAAPFSNTIALVTGERGEIIDYRVTSFNTNSAVLEIPIKTEYLPNVYLGVVLIKAPEGAQALPQFKIGYARLAVSTTSKELHIAVTTDRARYAPGEEAIYRIKATDSDGKGVPSELSFAMVDAAVLSLADDRSGDLQQAFYGARPLGVQTAAVLALSIDRVNRDLGRARKGAGDGPAGAEEVRTLFPDTAYWNPSVRTDANGDATVVVKLPDSLTTWRARLRGSTADTKVGSAQYDVVATKDLLLRPVTPRFLVAGDEPVLQAIVHNYADAPTALALSLAVTGLQSAQDNAFETQRFTVPAQGQQKVSWPAKVALGASSVELTFRATPLASGQPGDAVRLTLPVRPPATAEVTATSSEVRGSITELLRLGKELTTEQGELTIDTSPSLAAGMRYSLGYLEEYPYECTEQTVSRFLPRIVMQRAFDLLGLPDKEGIAARLPDIIGRNLQRLYKGQHVDGGWGWWTVDQSDPSLTAYALYGLSEARQSGQAVDDGVINRAAQFLRGYLAQPGDAAQPEDANRRAYVLFALAQAGKGDLGLTKAAFERRSTLGNYGKAFLAIALNSLNDVGADDSAKTLVADLSGAALLSASAAHWEEDAIDYRTMNTNTRTTAIVLDALVKLAPDSPLVPDAVRWLMVARREGHWETTQETAWSVLALTDYLTASGELQADYSYQIKVNDRAVGTGRASAENVAETSHLRVALKELLAGDNQVTIARQRDGGQTGLGRLFYTLGLRYFVPSEQVAPAGEGVAVMREYQRLGNNQAQPVDVVAAGDTLKVKLTIAVSEDMHYFIVEDALPAGAEAMDTQLKTTSATAAQEQGLQAKKNQDVKKGEQAKPPIDDRALRRWYFNQPEVRDDRVALFATNLPKGTYEYSYLIRATTPGIYQALPTRAYEMYFPEVWGRGAGNRLEVRP